jgi:hypothetical protein
VTLKRLIDSETAAALRRLAGAAPTTSEHSRERDLQTVALAGVFNVETIAVEDRSTRRVSCRECTRDVEIGQAVAVAFDFDPFYADTHGQRWGSLSRAYIHAVPCKEEK